MVDGSDPEANPISDLMTPVSEPPKAAVELIPTRLIDQKIPLKGVFLTVSEISQVQEELKMDEATMELVKAVADNMASPVYVYGKRRRDLGRREIFSASYKQVGNWGPPMSRFGDKGKGLQPYAIEKIVLSPANVIVLAGKIEGGAGAVGLLELVQGTQSNSKPKIRFTAFSNPDWQKAVAIANTKYEELVRSSGEQNLFGKLRSGVGKWRQQHARDLSRLEKTTGANLGSQDAFRSYWDNPENAPSLLDVTTPPSLPVLRFDIPPDPQGPKWVVSKDHPEGEIDSLRPILERVKISMEEAAVKLNSSQEDSVAG